jgi:two-component system response regulator NreC
MENQNIEIDAIELKIIQLLAQGIRNKNLRNYLHLSNSSIEKRKQKLKKKLNLIGNDEDLLRKAKENKWI